MSDIPLRHNLPLAQICTTTRPALSAGHDFVFDDHSSSLIKRVADLIESEKNFGRDYSEFARPPFARMTLSLSFPGADWLLLLVDGRASFYVRTPSGRIGKAYEDIGFIEVGEPWRDPTLSAALLILNQPRSYTISDRPACRRFVRGKVRAFAAHHLVSIDLSERQIVRLVRKAGSGTKQRRHERRGHFSHRGGDRFTCVHEWVREDYEANEHWRCSLCGRLRFWIKTYDAGDAGIGFSTKQYAITASHARPQVMEVAA